MVRGGFHAQRVHPRSTPLLYTNVYLGRILRMEIVKTRHDGLDSKKVPLFNWKSDEKWSGRRDSNSRPRRPERRALTRLRYAPIPERGIQAVSRTHGNSFFLSCH